MATQCLSFAVPRQLSAKVRAIVLTSEMRIQPSFRAQGEISYFELNSEIPHVVRDDGKGEVRNLGFGVSLNDEVMNGLWFVGDLA